LCYNLHVSAPCWGLFGRKPFRRRGALIPLNYTIFEMAQYGFQGAM
jgi:hypothetical protein